MIKAIETTYNGYCFRSRLEARWAVFFDILGIKYDYELEGFECGEAGYYLPDFYLKHSRFFIEVKPVELSQSEKRKVKYLDDYPPKYAMGCIPVVGIPEYPKFLIDNEYKYLYGWEGNTAFIVIQEKVSNRSLLVRAIKTARQARFEYGETPIMGGGK